MCTVNKVYHHDSNGRILRYSYISKSETFFKFQRLLVRTQTKFMLIKEPLTVIKAPVQNLDFNFKIPFEFLLQKIARKSFMNNGYYRAPW